MCGGLQQKARSRTERLKQSAYLGSGEYGSALGSATRLAGCPSQRCRQWLGLLDVRLLVVQLQELVVSVVNHGSATAAEGPYLGLQGKRGVSELDVLQDERMV